MPPAPKPDFAADVVWFDAFVTNPDRTPRNTNLLEWHGRIWLIDHGASLYFHHDRGALDGRVADPFERVQQHVLLPFAGDLAEADARARGRLSDTVFEEIVAAVPDAWLSEHYGGESPEAVRGHYLEYLAARLECSSVFVEEAGRV